MTTWRTNRQTISWFLDIHKRSLLDRDPPYQRRSVWNQRYKQDFIETVLLGYPAPSVFLYEEVSEFGTARYAVVDGKQRLTSIIEFFAGEFATGSGNDTKLNPDVQGVYFSALEPDDRKRFFGYEMTVEYIPLTEESFLNEVFDRLNRNVAKLSRQELRHARYGGRWATAAETLAGEFVTALGSGFPRISLTARLQMKDVEYTAHLMLLVENGPSSTTQDGLDEVYSERDDDWSSSNLESDFRRILKATVKLADADPELRVSRFRNQVDFYGLFGALRDFDAEGRRVDSVPSASALIEFASRVDEVAKLENPDHEDVVGQYHFATRSAANNVGSRVTRVEILKSVLVAK